MDLPLLLDTFCMFSLAAAVSMLATDAMSSRLLAAPSGFVTHGVSESWGMDDLLLEGDIILLFIGRS